jgi:glutamine amidotransferase
MPKYVTIVDYQAGNLTSVCLALETLGWSAAATQDPDDVRRADRLVFPGVGAAPAAMARMTACGMADAVREYGASGRPMLGICLGAQIILDRSEEGHVPCLALVQGCARRLNVPSGVKVPHMGWNAVSITRSHPLWEGIDSGSQFYFVHSYAPAPADPAATVGVTDYCGRFTSALAHGSIAACQFHPERSGRVGLKVLENFLSWEP